MSKFLFDGQDMETYDMIH